MIPMAFAMGIIFCAFRSNKPPAMPGEEESFSKKSLPLEGKVAFVKQMTDEV